MTQPTNMSITNYSTPYRPPMKQEDHPDHNMPESEHDGSVLTDPMHGKYVPEAPIARYDGDGSKSGSVKY